MCIGPFAPKPAQTPTPPPTPPAPVPVQQNIVGTGGTDRTRARQRASLAGGTNRTLLSGALASPPSTGSSLLG